MSAYATSHSWEDWPETWDLYLHMLVDRWIPLTLLVNSLNRSLGQDDAYPFALAAGALEKLRFVHDTIFKSCHPAARLNRP